jgi:hypothetical protein
MTASKVTAFISIHPKRSLVMTGRTAMDAPRIP